MLLLFENHAVFHGEGDEGRGQEDEDRKAENFKLGRVEDGERREKT